MTDSSGPSDAAADGIPRRTLGGLLGVSALASATGPAAPSSASAAPGGGSARRMEQPIRARTDRTNMWRPNLLVILADDLGWADLSCWERTAATLLPCPD
ncbi:hypothetical protein GCM10010393_22970 [Streptomyces gobitricini]|uniref:Sulfatase N-terminal domain-containing protein n=1 Tax=Streptomyces gobitricini TaxID=68211 RepID=A0ABP5Z3R4_9ACTN